jgi:hypothetical protein
VLSHGLQRVISTDGTSEKATQDQISSGADLKLVLFCRFENGPLGTGHDDESSLPVSAWVVFFHKNLGRRTVFTDHVAGAMIVCQDDFITFVGLISGVPSNLIKTSIVGFDNVRARGIKNTAG